MAASTIVRELISKLGFDFDASDWTKAQKATDLVKAGLVAAAGAAAALTSALAAAVIETTAEAGRLKDLSQRTGIATQALQELEHAAKLGGIEASTLEQGLGFLARNMRAAADGSDEAAKGFAAAGIRVRGANGQLRAMDDVLAEAADKFAKMPDGTRKTALAMQLFGRSGAQLIPLLNAGRAGIEELRQEARDLGIVLSDDVVAAGDDVGDNMDRLKALALGLGRTVAGPLLRPLADLLDRLIQWARANRGVIKTRLESFANSLVRGLQALGRAALFVTEHIKFFGVVLGSVVLAALLSNLAAAAALAGGYAAAGWAALLAGGKAALAWIAAAAPVALLAVLLAAVALAAEDVYTYLQGGDSVIGEFGPKWTKFLDEWSKPMAGDPEWLLSLKAAVRFASDLETQVPKAVHAIRAYFAEFFGWLVERAVAAAQKVGEVLSFGLYKGEERTPRGAGVGAMRWAEKNPMTAAAMWNPLAIPGAIAEQFGGGASPAASASQTPANTPAVTVAAPNVGPITVNAAPGMDAGAVAGEVRKQVEDVVDTKLREAAAATR